MFTPSTGKSRNWFTKVRHRYAGNGYPDVIQKRASGKSWPQIMRLRSLGLEFEIVHEVSDNVGIAFFMLHSQHGYVVMAT